MNKLVDIQDTKTETNELSHSLYSLGETNIVGIFFWNADRKISYANDKFLHILGYSKKDLDKGLIDWKKLIPGDYSSTERTIITNLIRKGSSPPLQKDCYRKDGSRVTVLIAAAFFDNSQTAGVGFILDITEEKKAKEELEASQKRFKQLVENNPVGILESNFDGDLLYANKTFLEITGYSREDFEKKLINRNQITPPEYHQADKDAVEEMKKTGISKTREKEYICKDARRVWVEIGAQVLDQKKGIYICFVQDITEKKKAQEQLKKHQERLELAQKAGNIGTFEWNLRTGKVFWSPELEALYGLKPREFKGKYASWKDRVHRDDIENFEKKIHSALKGEDAYNAEFRVVWPNGGIKWILAKGEVIFNEEGEALRVIGVNIDITDRKQIEHDLEESEHRFRTMADTAPVLIWLSGRDKRRYYFNKQWLKFTGRTYAQEQGFGWLEDVHPKDYEKVFNIYSSSFDKRQSYQYEYRLRRHDGVYRWILAHGIPRFEQDGTFLGYIGTCIDITEIKNSQKRLRENKNRFQALVENSYDATALVTENGTITYAGPSTKRVLGYRPENLIGKNGFDIIHPEDKQQVMQAITELILKPKSTIHLEYRVKHKDGSWRCLEVVATNLLCEKYVNAIVVNYRDISDKKESEAKIHKLAYYDQLTGAPNRVLFHDRLRQELHRANRNKSKVAVLFIDLDRFKNINDSLGHRTGDLILQKVSKRISKCIREADTVSRQGEDEFSVILADLAADYDAAAVAQKIINKLSKPFTINKNKVYISVSIGMSLYPTDATSQDQLIMCADMAMYSSKKQRGSNYQFFNNELSNQYLEQILIEKELRSALTKRELQVYYQPKVDILTGEVEGMETLLRWPHKTLGYISPSKFIPIAEETGLIDEIMEFVTEEACFQTHEWVQKYKRPLCVSVNFTFQQIQNSFIQKVEHFIEKSGLKPGSLEVELTERVIIQDEESTIRNLKKLKELGVKVTIDDFGTGHSSLNLIGSLPIDKVKIEGSFIRQLEKVKTNPPIVKAIIAMARNLNLEVVAEEVETESQFLFLKKHKCDTFQGYLFKRPLSKEDFELMLKNREKLEVKAEYITLENLKTRE